MNPLENLLQLSSSEKEEKGLVATPGEIAQQPRTWRKTLNIFQERRQEISDFLQRAGLKGSSGEPPTVLLVGAGSSDYVGRSLVSLLRNRWNCEVLACPSTDLALQLEGTLRAGTRYLAISFSRSGDSPEGVAVVERLLKFRPDVPQLVVTCNRDGKMAQAAQQAEKGLTVCLDDEVNDRGLAMTSSFSNMVVLGQCLAHVDSIPGYAKILEGMADAAERFLPIAASSAAESAKADYRKACFVGTGSLQAVARESALKLLEMTAGRIQTMSESTLGLRHGPMAALDDDTLFVAYLSSDERLRSYDQALLKEIGSKRLVRTRIAIGPGSSAELDGWADNFLAYSGTAAIPDDYRTPVDVIFGQLLGLFFSLRCGLRPDSPSPTGAISRVVQSVSFT